MTHFFSDTQMRKNFKKGITQNLGKWSYGTDEWQMFSGGLGGA